MKDYAPMLRKQKEVKEQIALLHKNAGTNKGGFKGDWIVGLCLLAMFISVLVS